MEVDYGVIAREGKRGELATIVLGSPVVLAEAEKTWDAVSVAAGGELITEHGIYDNVEYWYADDLPVALEIGHLVRGFIYLKNIYASYEHFRTELEFIDPDGYSRGHCYEHNYLDPGAEGTAIMGSVTLDKPGTWKLHVIVEIV